MYFSDRKDAGRRLLVFLEKYKKKDAIVYALPRGGVVLGSIIAKLLNKPLDLIIPRKIGHPLNPEYAIGAVGESGILVINKEEEKNIDKNWLKEKISEELAESKRRRKLYTGEKMMKMSDEGKIAIIVDDGIATGFTIKAAINDIKTLKPKKIVVAVPVIPYDSADKLKREVDELIYLYKEEHFISVGSYYLQFPQLEDKDVISLIKDNRL